MTITNLNKLRCLLEEVEKEEGVCYKRYSEEVRRYLLWRYALPELRVLADARKL